VKLNGWQRIGIVASVTWILGAGLHTLNSEIEGASKAIASDHIECVSNLAGMTEEARKKGFDECNKEASSAFSAAIVSARLEALMVALLPVPFGWGLGYLAPFLVSWVRRGLNNRVDGIRNQR
jgi:hypothetical protein